MSGKKNTASLERDSVKISKLGEELNVDPREIVAAAKDMTIENAKVPASWVTAGQADRLRAKFGGNKDLKAKLERKQRYLESGELDEEVKPAAAPQTQPVKMGKETYELDRRSIFGVVANSEGERVERFGARGLHAKPAVSGITKPPPKPPEPVMTENADSPILLEGTAPAPAPAKKFIGIQVAPPVRRAGEIDSRFGVVVAAPEPEKPVSSAPAPNMGLWGKLNDGRAPIEMPVAAENKELEEASEILHERGEVEELPPQVQPVAAQTPAPAAVPVQRAPIEEIAPSGRHSKIENVVALPPKIDDVPVKWQPKHKAFGAKQKIKHHKAKQLEAEPKKAEKKEKPARPHEVVKHAASAHSAPQKKHSERQPAKPEGLLSRLARKILGK